MSKSNPENDPMLRPRNLKLMSANDDDFDPELRQKLMIIM
jgi:hypothetical protein